MFDLLRADMVTQLRTKSLYYVLFSLPLLTVFTAMMDIKEGRVSHDDFFNSISYISLIAAYITGYTFGGDITQGTIRSKLIAGKSRTAIYLSKLTVCAVSVFAAVTASVLAVAVMTAVMGYSLSCSPADITETLLASFAASAAAVGFYMMINIIIRNQTYSVAAGMVTGFMMIIVSYIVVLGGDRRTFIVLRYILPTAYIRLIMSREVYGIPVLPSPLPVLAAAVLLTAAGIVLVNRVDLK